MNESLKKQLSKDPDGLLTYEYIANNSFVTIDLELLKYALLDDHPYLIFAFTKDGDWIPTGNDGYLTFSNVSFSYTLPA